MSILGRSNTKHRIHEAAASLPGLFREPVRSSFGWSSRALGRAAKKSRSGRDSQVMVKTVAPTPSEMGITGGS